MAGSKVDIERVEWAPTPQLLESFGDLVEMIRQVLILQDDLRRVNPKRNQPATGLLEQRTPEVLIKTLKEECDELLEGIQRRDIVNQCEEAADTFAKFVRLCATLELNPELIIRMFFVKERTIAEYDSVYGVRDRDAERVRMEALVVKHEGE